MRQQLRVFLETSGFLVLEADDGTAGLHQARNNNVDILIVDVHMPRMNGIEMIGEIRKLPDYVDTPIFVLTTDSASSSMAEAKAAGATAWIIKPFKPDILLKGIKKVLGIA
jgi:two-component system chemotaxis response regulator CheY